MQYSTMDIEGICRNNSDFIADQWKAVVSFIYFCATAKILSHECTRPLRATL
jgi:hypothetical protein